MDYGLTTSPFQSLSFSNALFRSPAFSTMAMSRPKILPILAKSRRDKYRGQLSLGGGKCMYFLPKNTHRPIFTCYDIKITDRQQPKMKTLPPARRHSKPLLPPATIASTERQSRASAAGFCPLIFCLLPGRRGRG